MSHPDRRGRELSHAAQGAFVVVAIFFAAFMFAIGLYVGQNSEPESAEGGGGTSPAMTETSGGGETEAEETEPAETEAEGDGAEEGQNVFASAGCANCHNLDEADATGSVGPDLDETGLDREGIEQVIRDGRGGMPAFEGSLEDPQIEAVADFVDASKG